MKRKGYWLGVGVIGGEILSNVVDGGSGGAILN